jgi:hypothetical protein
MRSARENQPRSALLAIASEHHRPFILVRVLRTRTLLSAQTRHGLTLQARRL